MNKRAMRWVLFHTLTPIALLGSFGIVTGATQDPWFPWVAGWAFLTVAALVTTWYKVTKHLNEEGRVSRKVKPRCQMHGIYPTRSAKRN